MTCTDNNLTELDVSANTEMIELKCSENVLATLDISANTELTWLNCSHNNLAELDITAITGLTEMNDFTNLKCGAQIYELTLKLTESQEAMWNSKWKDAPVQSDNFGVTLKVIK